LWGREEATTTTSSKAAQARATEAGVWRGEGIYAACRRQATRTTKNDGSVTVAVAFGELKREN
jgi:hypothetical protein